LENALRRVRQRPEIYVDSDGFVLIILGIGDVDLLLETPEWVEKGEAVPGTVRVRAAFLRLAFRVECIHRD
jgi:hypothetical protein